MLYSWTSYIFYVLLQWAKCFPAVLWPFSVKQTPTPSGMKKLFFYHRRVNNGTRRRTFSPPVRESCLSAVTARKNKFLLLFKLLTTVFYVYLLLISELHAWINNAPKQLKYNQLEITICSHGDWNFVLKRLWKKKGIWIKIVLSAHFCQQNPDTYISNHRIRADK